ncbi:MAG TPA: hypothetical protein VG407_10610 [Caulobacteraceae bacterium]|jgi:uncharacterized membrane protein YbjE (DUF340 family)|nr:hypothetical protein [Caulobacteraceae bacterium]
MASLIKIAAAAAIVAAVCVAVLGSGYALFVVADAQWGQTVAAIIVAVGALILAAIVALVWREAERRRRETKAAAAGLSDYLIDFAIERPVITALAGLAVGWICLRNPRLVALAAELLLVGRRRPER